MNTFSFTETNCPDLDRDISSDYQNSNKILLEKYTHDEASRVRRSPFSFDSSDPSIERPVFATPLGDRTITENSATVKFTCSVLSSDCDISWEKNSFPIRPSSKYCQTFSDGLAILEIFDATDDDAGKYNCVASNKHGESVTSAKLKVYSGFKPTVSMPPSVSRQMKGMVHRVGLPHSTLQYIPSHKIAFVFIPSFPVYLHMTIIIFFNLPFLYSAFSTFLSSGKSQLINPLTNNSKIIEISCNSL